MYARDMAIVLLITFVYLRAPSFALNTVFFTWNGALRTYEVVSVSGSKARTRPAFGVTLTDVRISMAARRGDDMAVCRKSVGGVFRSSFRSDVTSF